MYKKANKGWLKHLDFIIIDAICLQLSFMLAYLIRHGNLTLYEIPIYRSLAMLLFMLQIVITFFFESFKNILKRGYYKELSETIKHVSLVILITSFCAFITQTGELYSRITLLLTGVLYTVSTYFFRTLWKHYLHSHIHSKISDRSLLIITCKDNASTVLNNILICNYGTFHICGLVIMDSDMGGEYIDGIPVVSNLDHAVEYIKHKWVDGILINLPPNLHLPKDMINTFTDMGITVHQTLIDITILNSQSQRVERMGSYTVLTSSINMISIRQAVLKRLMDIAGGIIGCIITAFLYLVLAPCIYFQSPGPIFFSQLRVGKNGRKFRIYKFRSMYMDAEKRKQELMAQNRVKDGMMFKLDSDPRIIGGEQGVGSFIRKYSLDEFPQMWNVLKGDMSLVGTRPPTLDEWERYEPHHRARLSIKPGLTGLWQVSGRSRITEFEEVVCLDKKYITEWCFKLDLKIILKTVGVVLGREGAL